jgi:hypothetical protein
LPIEIGKAAYAASRQRTEEGLVGAGRLTLGAKAPALLRRQVEQYDRGREADPASGQPLRAILLSQFAPGWRNGRIGQPTT